MFIADDIRAKARRLYGDDGGRNVLKALFTDGTFAMVCYRCMQWCNHARLHPLTLLFNKLNVWFGNCIIGRAADFGPEFVLIHSTGVVINSDVKGGRGIELEHQVTIGAEKGLAPVLGDDVFIGAGAKLVGGVTIGSHVKIGANAVVLNHIPDNATAVGVPARVVE
ncbi:MAG: serine acetyltransferase [Verrucomicrobia bacterium]|nr:serine acetyltransferase [Verrucomicrobiota bacterium]